jgi:anti-sigma factor RsiW
MASVDKDIEKLMVRSLDGELSEDEQLRLNRELIRTPESRRLMEEYRRIDESAGAALNSTLGTERTQLDPADLPSLVQAQHSTGLNRGWWLVPGAIAAALLAVFVAQFPGPAASDTDMAQMDRANANHVVPPGPQAQQADGLMRNVGTNRVRRNTGREIIGVMGEDGNIYWIEVDRIQTIKLRPGSQGSSRRTGEEI